jgi:biopolymer transport protein ExbB
MKKIILFLLLCNFLYATQEDVALMLKNAKNSFSLQETINFKRETKFLDALNEQAKLLKKAKKEVQELKEKSIKLNNIIDSNEKLLSKAEEKLMIRSGNLGELYGVVKQNAGDMKAELSLSSTMQDNARTVFLNKLSKTNKLPNIEKLSEFWYIMLEELTLQGYVGKKTLGFINSDGKTVEKIVQTAGLFNAITDEGFAKYSPELSIFTTLSKQPSNSLTSIAIDGFESNEPIYETVIDPTRGQLLSLYTDVPTFEDRISQGSTIGYIIIIVGVLGLLYALYLGVNILLIQFSIKKQNKKSFVSNLQNTYEENQNQTLEYVELVMQERLASFKQKTHSGLALLKLLAAVAPLLGLLGTVTGMIATFSAITLFGTGDPKLMAGGISQALVTTVEGLVVAIPLLFAHTLLSSKAKDIMQNLDSIALKLLAKHQAK